MHHFIQIIWLKNGEWIEYEAQKNNTHITIEWIDKEITSVYQPGDISINKPLKEKIRTCYHKHITEKNREKACTRNEDKN